ncbi:MAG: RNA 2',3'-cyclic phosphodiesterase [Tumebacillaceae bacterium]
MGRYFVGIQVPEETGGVALEAVQQRLEPLLDVKRWYAPPQFHLTLHFLGNLEEPMIQQVIDLITPHTFRWKPFNLRLGSVGWFPRAKVVWCGVEGETDSLRSLQQAVGQDLTAVGAERFAHDEYRPHITLGRLQTVDPAFQPRAVETTDLLVGAEGTGITWRVDALHLFESVSGPDGPHYPIRHSFHLKQAGE